MSVRSFQYDVRTISGISRAEGHCGGWLKQNPIPTSQSLVGRSFEMRKNVQEAMREIIKSHPDTLYGKFTASCNDMPARDMAPADITSQVFGAAGRLLTD